LGIRYFFQIQGIHKMYKQDKVPPTDITVLRPWQEWVIKRLDKQDDRKILFIVDRKGGRGKSCLATHLMSQGEAWVCEGKRAHFVPRGMGGRNSHNCKYVSPPPRPSNPGGTNINANMFIRPPQTPPIFFYYNEPCRGPSVYTPLRERECQLAERRTDSNIYIYFQVEKKQI